MTGMISNGEGIMTAGAGLGFQAGCGGGVVIRTGMFGCLLFLHPSLLLLCLSHLYLLPLFLSLPRLPPPFACFFSPTFLPLSQGRGSHQHPSQHVTNQLPHKTPLQASCSLSTAPRPLAAEWGTVSLWEVEWWSSPTSP